MFVVPFSVTTTFALAALALPENFEHYLNLIKALEIPAMIIFGGKTVLAWPLCYHAFNGIRHLVGICWLYLYFCCLKSELINMTRAWNKENIWVPDRSRTCVLPNTRHALYLLSCENAWRARSFNWVHVWTPLLFVFVLVKKCIQRLPDNEG